MSSASTAAIGTEFANWSAPTRGLTSRKDLRESSTRRPTSSTTIGGHGLGNWHWARWTTNRWSSFSAVVQIHGHLTRPSVSKWLVHVSSASWITYIAPGYFLQQPVSALRMHKGSCVRDH